MNDRPRDVVDLLLLRELVKSEGTPSSAELREAAVAVFEARAADAAALGRPIRTWPPKVVAHEHWSRDYARAAADAGIRHELGEAVAAVNEWIAEIADSDDPST